ncbi:MAG: hypothetical protein COV34_03005 [Candidatus Zambryskibacteria bacterium CG10_big_fil_rev_8_21_14_0_10_42_12]|uniref:Plasmid maintenance system killer protein n=1 Tax=Candidatus Zambryskibacteria bacterium CG10_big_fil_rev_8_21_14_0_10_42_12 TaxID=1975115 RepID=A0A2H0QTY4_9BACT|nr:MAG: hypothetical protein COV34_03005 [Candidatus Zambryskibacteria bacterium CG10_big_fil_rev_8_21_14_0_10_42_12]
MEISFSNKKLQKLCEDHNKLKAKYGALQARRIIRRINELQAAANLHDISQLPQARLHSLTGDRKGQFAVDILHPYRIILLPLDGDTADLRTIQVVEIVSIIDYH